MPRSHHQIVITGAGIAGLWCLRRLLARGYDAILLEREATGCGQTLGSQGILHGGVKYGLDGTSRDIAALLKSQPARWLECFAGRGEIDLSAARINAPCQHLWAADNWLAKAGATLGVRAMQGEVRRLTVEAWPAALRDGGHRGSVYELQEMVIETRSVCEALAAPVADRILRGEVTGFDMSGENLRVIRCGDVEISADAFLFTAATGNEAAAEALGFGREATQRRPLKMLMARGPLPPLYGHCVTLSPRPVVTITTHAALQNESIWYMGGNVAEEGATLDDDAAIASARQTMTRLLTRLDWRGVRWAAWTVDRAEPNAANRLPDGPALLVRGSAAICWPAKLVYAPALADRAEAFVANLTNPSGAVSAAPPLPRADMGKYPWETAVWSS